MAWKNIGFCRESREWDSLQGHFEPPWVRENDISNLKPPVGHQRGLVLKSIFLLFQVLFGGFGISEKLNLESVGQQPRQELIRGENEFSTTLLVVDGRIQAKNGGPSIRCQVKAAHSSSRSCRCLFRCSLLFLDGTIKSFSSWLSPGFQLVLTSQPESIPPREQRWRHPNSLPFSDASDHVQPRDMEPLWAIWRGVVVVGLGRHEVPVQYGGLCADLRISILGDAQWEWSQMSEEASMTFEYSSKVIDSLFNLFRLIIKRKAWQACLVFWCFFVKGTLNFS